MKAYLRVILLTTLPLWPLMAVAGQIQYADGQGQWRSSNCLAPIAPNVGRTFIPAGTTAASAADLRAAEINTAILAHNDYTAKAQAYMACLAREASSDAAAASQLITDQAQAQIREIQNNITRSQQQFQRAQ